MWDLIISVPDHCLSFCFVSCSDFVGYGNSLSNIITFLLSYTELITSTALELAIGFPEGFYLNF